MSSNIKKRPQDHVKNPIFIEDPLIQEECHRKLYLLWDVVARHGGDARHEVAGDEGADHHRAPAGGLLLQGVPVKVEGCEDHWHLADLA